MNILHQEELIAQKKREIEARMEQKAKQNQVASPQSPHPGEYVHSEAELDLRGSRAEGFACKSSHGISAPSHSLMVQGVTQVLSIRRLSMSRERQGVHGSSVNGLPTLTQQLLLTTCGPGVRGVAQSKNPGFISALTKGVSVLPPELLVGNMSQCVPTIAVQKRLCILKS